MRHGAECVIAGLAVLIVVGARVARGQTSTPAWRVAALQQRALIMAPRPEYRQWYDALVSKCGCKPAVAFDEIVWHRMQSRTFPCLSGGRHCWGLWVPDLAAVFLADRRADDELAVSHELLHAILGRADHPPIFRRLGLEGAGL